MSIGTASRRVAHLSPPRGTPGDDALVLVRVFEAPPERVFALWSDPAQVAQWWQPDGYATPVYEMDFRVGGAFRYRIVGPRPGEDRWACGEYRAIEAPHRIVMTFRWDSGDLARDRETLITVTFAAEGEGATRMTFRQSPFASDAARHGHGQGWSQVLESFGRFLSLRSST